MIPLTAILDVGSKLIDKLIQTQKLRLAHRFSF
jgi:hypothetical protein